jgi:hypothetical protein
MIVLPLWIAIVIIGIGFVLWLTDVPRRRKQRRLTQQTAKQLEKDLVNPSVASSLPYGYAPSEDVDEDSEAERAELIAQRRGLYRGVPAPTAVLDDASGAWIRGLGG